MKNKKINKIFNTIILIITAITLCLAILYNSAFIPSFMLMLSLFLFGVSYYIKDYKKTVMYILFIIGVLLIFGAVGYTIMRFM